MATGERAQLHCVTYSGNERNQSLIWILASGVGGRGGGGLRRGAILRLQRNGALGKGSLALKILQPAESFNLHRSWITIISL